jgi:hypothetical protein
VDEEEVLLVCCPQDGTVVVIDDDELNTQVTHRMIAAGVEVIDRS